MKAFERVRGILKGEFSADEQVQHLDLIKSGVISVEPTEKEQVALGLAAITINNVGQNGNDIIAAYSAMALEIVTSQYPDTHTQKTDVAFHIASKSDHPGARAAAECAIKEKGRITWAQLQLM